MAAETPLVETRKKCKDEMAYPSINPQNDNNSRDDIGLLSQRKSYRSQWIVLFIIISILVIAVILVFALIVSTEDDSDSASQTSNNWPIIVITQQTNPEVADEGFQVLLNSSSTLSAIVAAGTLCEEVCPAVGWGEKPDSEGETTLDAMIIYGPTRKAGCVGQLRRIKPAMSVARDILVYTKHTLLVGESATEFAKSMGYQEESLSSNASIQDYQDWLDNNCQPTFWQNMVDVNDQCGPYTKIDISDKEFEAQENNLLDGNKNDNVYQGLVDDDNHDTVSLVAIDKNGIMSVGTTTNGLTHKIHGRIGDSPIPGGGSYVIQGIGGCGATGNGDIMVRFLPTYKAVQHMANGYTPYEAIQLAMDEIREIHPTFSGNMICVAADGTHASGNSNPNIPKRYVVRDMDMEQAQIWTCPNGDCYAE